MIKEIYYQKDRRTNERIYDSVELDTIMEKPFKLKIELLKEINYFHERLSSISINIVNKIPKAD